MMKQETIRPLEDLLDIFLGYQKPEDIPANFDLLREIQSKEIPIQPEFIKEYENLKSAQKKDMLDAIHKDLWMLAHQKEIDPQTRRDLYERWSKGYEKFFDWEQVSEPGIWCGS
jgi:hypothetical protein